MQRSRNNSVANFVDLVRPGKGTVFRWRSLCPKVLKADELPDLVTVSVCAEQNLGFLIYTSFAFVPGLFYHYVYAGSEKKDHE
jgi:hypothetical protein